MFDWFHNVDSPELTKNVLLDFKDIASTCGALPTGVPETVIITYRHFVSNVVDMEIARFGNLDFELI